MIYKKQSQKVIIFSHIFKVFCELNQHFLNDKSLDDNTGSTALVAIIRENEIIIINLGDSKAILIN